ncbi:hypothetical protein Tco_0044337 [Tanacetum coccineum]
MELFCFVNEVFDSEYVQVQVTVQQVQHWKHVYASKGEIVWIGLYHAKELDEEGFDVYFQGGLRSDKHFNAQEYWLSINREENLSLSSSHDSTIRNPVLRVLHKMITYGLCQRTNGYDKIQKNNLWQLSMFNARNQNRYANVSWLIARWMKRKGPGTQRESLICYGQFIMKLARKTRVLSDEVLKSLSALIYYRDLDTTTLRELIDSEGRLIPEAPQPDIPRVAIPRAQRASMQDLYERIGSMEIRQGAIERMAYRKSYQWDRYAGLHPRIHQKHWTDPGDGGSVGRTSCSPRIDLNFKRLPINTNLTLSF